MSVRDLWSKKALSRAPSFILLNKFHKDVLAPYRHRFKHTFYINETIPPPVHDCDAVGGAFYYLVLRMQNPCRRQSIIYKYLSLHPSLRLSIRERRQTNRRSRMDRRSLSLKKYFLMYYININVAVIIWKLNKTAGGRIRSQGNYYCLPPAGGRIRSPRLN